MRITAALLASLMLTTAAGAADLIIEQPPTVVPTAAWDGFYFGIHGGGATGTETDDQSEFFGGGGGGGTTADSISIGGWLLGLHAGANVQMDSFVLGVEGIVDLTNIEGEQDYDYYDGQSDYYGTLHFASNWQASLNVRAGVAIDTLLLYGSLGVAVADGTLTDSVYSPDPYTYEDSATHVGWTIAAGAELMFDENWSGRVEVRHTQFGDADYDLGFMEPVTASFSTTALTVGLSYRF